MHGAISPDYDDDDGGITGHASDRAWAWRRGGSKASAWSCGCWRFVIFAIVNTLRNSSVFHIYGFLPETRLVNFEARKEGGGFGRRTGNKKSSAGGVHFSERLICREKPF